MARSVPAAGPANAPNTQVLNVANAGTGPLGTAYDCGGAFTFFSIALVTTGVFTTGTAQMQGSNDAGVTWFNIGAAVAIVTGNQLFTSGAAVVGPFRQVRLNLTAAVTGGGTIGTMSYACAGA